MTTLNQMKTIPMDAYPTTHDPCKVLQTLLITAEDAGLRPSRVDYGEDDVITYDATAANATVIDDAMAADECWVWFTDSAGNYAGRLWFIPCNGCDAISDWTVDNPLDPVIGRALDLIHGSY